jgi:UV DNA damage endonuclease
MGDFIDMYNKLDEKLRNRRVIENNEHSCSLEDCIDINKQTGVPIVLYTLHHEHLKN